MEQLNGESPNLKVPFPYMNSNTELLNSLSALESNLNSNVQGLVAFPNGGFFDHQHPDFPMTLVDSTRRCLGSSDGPCYTPVTHFFPSTASGIGLVADHNNPKKNYDLGARKRKRNDKKEAEKPREVIHVRAKRGQATDGHSLAERSRREKINKKLRSLQDLVPGCDKTMGMAVTLDVIIDYIRSLQNQIEFLSMKLSAASLFYDFNSEMDTMDTTQGISEYVAQGMLGEGYGELSCFPSTWPL